MPGEITKEHLCRKAYIYVRQSSQRQVIDHHASHEVQRNLLHRARFLGWADKNIKIIDEDLGTSATGSKKRSGYEKLMSNICLGNIGAIFILYASRLARNGKEWHHSLQMCSLFKVLIIDRDTIYDPRLPNDRLWLGMQGSFSEYEVSQMQIRAKEAILLKASKGELIKLLPAGFIATEDRRIELDPDQRIRQAIAGVFNRFDQLGSVRQVNIYYRQQQLQLPVRNIKKGFKVVWRLPDYHTVYRILTNPIYAGIYMYPKTKTITRVTEGRVVKTAGHRVGKEDNPVLIYDLFAAYIDKEQYERNQQIIAENANVKPGDNKGAAREGKSLLNGLLRCGHCSRKLLVRYATNKTQHYYYCSSAVSVNVRKGCISFSGSKLDAIISGEIINVLQPHAIEAAILAEEKCHQMAKEKQDSIYYALEEARYEAGRIERQYNSVEPENYLVSRTLSERWQQALEKVVELEQQYQQALSEQKTITAEEKKQLFELANHLERVWEHPDSDARTKTRLVRLLIHDIWVKRVDDKKIKATIHWQGGVHTECEFYRRKWGSKTKGQKTNAQRTLEQLLKELALVCDDTEIARILNRNQYQHAQMDNATTWSQSLVRQLRQKFFIPEYSRDIYKKRNLINLKQAAQSLQVSMSTILQMIRYGVIDAHQVIKYAPWEIAESGLDKPKVNTFLRTIRKGKPVTFNKDQLGLSLEAKDVKEQ